MYRVDKEEWAIAIEDILQGRSKYPYEDIAERFGMSGEALLRRVRQSLEPEKYGELPRTFFKHEANMMTQNQASRKENATMHVLGNSSLPNFNTGHDPILDAEEEPKEKPKYNKDMSKEFWKQAERTKERKRIRHERVQRNKKRRLDGKEKKREEKRAAREKRKKQAIPRLRIKQCEESYEHYMSKYTPEKRAALEHALEHGWVLNPKGKYGK